MRSPPSPTTTPPRSEGALPRMGITARKEGPSARARRVVAGGAPKDDQLLLQPSTSAGGRCRVVFNAGVLPRQAAGKPGRYKPYRVGVHTPIQEYAQGTEPFALACMLLLRTREPFTPLSLIVPLHAPPPLYL